MTRSVVVGWLSFGSWCFCCILRCSRSSSTYSVSRTKRAAHLGWPLALSSVLVALTRKTRRALSLFFSALFISFPSLFIGAGFSSVPHKYTNTLTRARARRIYTRTTAAFHDPPPFPSHFCVVPPSFCVPLPPPVSSSNLVLASTQTRSRAYIYAHARARTHTQQVQQQ